MSSSTITERPCSRHAGARALYHCQDCGRDLCFRCVDSRFHGRHSTHSCRECRGLVQELSPFERPREQEAPDPSGSSIIDVLAFPLRSSNAFYWLACSAILLAAEAQLLYTQHYPTARYGYRRGRGLWILLLVYLAFNLLQVLAEAARGSRKAPRWINPAGRDYEVPWTSTAYVLSITAIGWGPLIAALLWGGEWALVYAAGALIFALLYMPLALIATALDCSVGLRLDRLPAELVKFGGAYLASALAFGLVTGLFVGGLLMIYRLDSWMWLWLHAPLVAYAALALMHQLGALFRRREHALNWF